MPMATNKNDRLAPPLMYAFRAAHEKRDAKQRLDLRDEAGERVIAARRATMRSPISESGLRREVMTDLLSLLNTTNLDAAQDLSTLPAVRSSILNYGFPDLSWRTIDENSLSDVAREIEVALTDFEPRLARGSIKASRDASVAVEDLKLRFLVKADLRAQPVNVPVEFVAEVELDGKIRIDRV
ncbi:MAG TPA: type VI secretion system baseplate subunit TssE [Roseiarcus sp.]|nr:type VI secretion system baseplate subunit TssE [Roseiarcus sp.]